MRLATVPPPRPMRSARVESGFTDEWHVQVARDGQIALVGIVDAHGGLLRAVEEEAANTVLFDDVEHMVLCRRNDT